MSVEPKAQAFRSTVEVFFPRNRSAHDSRKSSLSGELPPGAAGEVVERTIQPHRKRKVRWREPETIDTMERRLEAHVFPYIGTRDVKLLTSQELLTVLRRIEERGTFELARRVRSICSRVLRYGKATGRRCEDVATDLIGLLVPYESERMAAIIEPRKAGALLRAIDHYHGNDVTRLAQMVRRGPTTSTSYVPRRGRWRSVRPVSVLETRRSLLLAGHSHMRVPAKRAPSSSR